MSKIKSQGVLSIIIFEDNTMSIRSFGPPQEDKTAEDITDQLGVQVGQTFVDAGIAKLSGKQTGTCTTRILPKKEK